MKKLILKDFEIGGDKLTIIAGPCAIESEYILFKTAEKLKEITGELGINYVFKASYDKANRSSIDSYRGLGIMKGLELLQKVKDKFDVPILTDFHSAEQAAIAAQVADIIQVPAFLCRQTDILVEAAKTGKIVNIKKGQFLSPYQMKPLIKKVEASGNNQILLTERGASFGYNNLICDMRSIKIMQDMGYPVVFDATHSVQIPGGKENSSGGERQFVPLLARSAVAAGARVLFFEIHPNPCEALCDGDNMLSLEETREVFEVCREIFEVAQ